MSTRPQVASSSSVAAARTYDDAIDALNSLQSNAATIEALRKSGGRLLDFAIPEMVEYLERIGYRTLDLNRLNVIHITGTKGKGSTSSFVDSLLRQLTPVQGSAPPKVGLYTSPHMTSVRERIRINGQPVSHELFTKYFWQVWDRLSENPERKFDLTPLRPVYFRFLTLLAFHVFLSEGVQPVILEVGIGGKYDSTNIVPKCVVAGITQLGLDHTAILGNTVEEIAVQKAGIFKTQAPAVCWAQQPGKALEEVKRVAKEVGVSDLKIVDVHPALRSEASALGTEDASTVSLGLPGFHQRTNASVALELVNAYLDSEVGRAQFKNSAHRGDMLARWQNKGLEDARWPGRCQTVPTARSDLGLTWYLDGAHTTDSLSVCLGWFTAIQQHEAGKKRNKRMFVFNCTNGRNAHELLSAVLGMIEKGIGGGIASNGSQYQFAKDYFDEVIFTTNITFEGGGWSSELTSKLLDDAELVNLTVQKQLAETWKELVPASSTKVRITPSIQAMHNHVVETAQEQGKEGCVDCLVSGSLHLVGGVMAHLQQSGCLDDSLVSTVRPC